MANGNEIDVVTLYLSRKGLQEGERIAGDLIGWPCSMVVVDKAGAVIAGHRMDGAPPATYDIAVEKAWTAATFLAPTLMLGRMTDPRTALMPLDQLPQGHHGMGLQFKHKGRLTTIMGGIPVRDKNMTVIGGVGTSGTPSANDDNIVSQRCWSAMYDWEDPPLKSRLDGYVKVVEAVMSKAAETGLEVAVCLSDPEGWPKVQYRMDGAIYPAAELARDKAWTAAAFRMPSGDISRFGVKGQPGLGIPLGGWNERVCPIPGGLPIFGAGGELLGSVGVSGGTPSQDARIARAAVEATV
ncbi:MAG: heme-binding protein [Actinomycetota bacterium]|nr:heme-binding protein [Actinomycetota bacterium]